MFSSLHNHSTFCDGKNTPEEMIVSALKAGITDFGISRHSDASEILQNETFTEDEYLTALRRIQKENCLPINFYVGVEEDLFMPVKDRSKYDYVIGSTHYVKKGDTLYAIDHTEDIFLRGINEVFGGDAYAYCEQYYRQVLSCAKKKPDILGHFDLLRKCGGKFIDFSSKKYRDIALSCAEECVKAVIFEVNYGAIPRKRLIEPYPTDEILRYIRQKGGRVTVSTDCHDESFIAFGLAEGEEKLRSLGFKEIMVYKSGKFEGKKL